MFRIVRKSCELGLAVLASFGPRLLTRLGAVWQNTRQGLSRLEVLSRRVSVAGRRLARGSFSGLRKLTPRRRRSRPATSAPSLMQWIWRESRREQIPILAVIVCSLPFYYLVFDLPKHIINGPIQGGGFPTPDATRSLAQLVPLVAQVGPLASLEFDRWSALLMLSGLFAALIVVNGCFKLVINTAKGWLGEAMLQRLRGDLFARVLALPTRDARRLSGAETASIIKDEVEPLGGFIGDAFIMPVLLGAKALTAALFILMQSVWLGSIAVGIVMVQALIVPRLRRRLIVLGQRRQLTARELSGRVGEVVEGIGDVHVNNAVAVEKADIHSRLERIAKIRYEIYRRKFAIKYINNMLADVPTLVFFLLGGLLVLEGQMDVGQLVAVIVAYGELPGPIKELIDWDYQRQDMMVRFDQVTLLLPPTPASLTTHEQPQAIAIRPGDLLPLRISNLAVDLEASGERLKCADLSLAKGEHVAATGEAGAGASALALALIGEATPSSGSIMCAGGVPYIARKLLGERIAYVGEDPYIQQSSIRAALLYGARATVGAAISAQRLGEVLKLVQFDDDILALALASKFKGRERGDLAAVALAARRALEDDLSSGDLARVVVRYHPDSYNDEASIEANLAVTRRRADSAAVLTILKRHDLEHRLEAIGLAMAATAVELYGGLARDNILRVTQRLVPPDEIEQFQGLLARSDVGGPGQRADDDRQTLRSLALGYVEPRHRLGLIDDALKNRIVAARQELLGVIADEDARDPILLAPERYDDDMNSRAEHHLRQRDARSGRRGAPGPFCDPQDIIRTRPSRRGHVAWTLVRDRPCRTAVEYWAAPEARAGAGAT